MSTALPSLPDTRSDDPASGWRSVWTLAAAQLVSWGTIYYSFSLFVLPMQAELGWSKSEINGALSCGLLMAGFCSFPVGSWIDRHGGRAVMSVGTIVAIALLIAWSRVDGLASFYGIWLGIGFAMAGTLYEPAFVVLTQRFPETFARRITALTLVAGFASTIFVPLTQFLIDAVGWRLALVILAFCNAVVCLPAYASLPRPPANLPRAPEKDPAAREQALSRAIRRPAFWGLALSFTAYHAAFAAITFHIVPMLLEQSVPTAVVLVSVALIGPSQVAGRFVLLTRGGFAVRSVGRATVLLLPTSLLILATLPPSPVALAAFAILYGAGNGIMTIVRGTSVPALFGSEAYGAINGALAVPINLAAASAPLAIALLREESGSYAVPLSAIACSAVVAAVAYWMAVIAPTSPASTA